LVLAAAGVTAPAAAPAQARDRLAEAIRAYQDVDFELAARLLQQEVARLSSSGGAPGDRVRALMYLGAAELFRGKRDSAATAFRRLVLLDPRYRPDRLIFPPEITGAFERVRETTKTVAIVPPRDTEIVPGTDSLRVWLVASSEHTVDVTLRYDDGGPFRSLYRGPIGDSLTVKWDGLDAAGLPAPVDRVLLRVVSFAPGGQLAVTQQLPLEIRRVRPDTMPWPPPPADSAFLPERAGKGPATRALLGGALLSGAAIAIPAVVGGSETSEGPRVALAAAVTVAGLVGWVLHRPGRPLVANVRANKVLRDAWQRQLSEVQAENARRLAAVRLAIHAGAPAPSGGSGL
jgi:hypothetical protein